MGLRLGRFFVAIGSGSLSTKIEILRADRPRQTTLGSLQGFPLETQLVFFKVVFLVATFAQVESYAFVYPLDLLYTFGTAVQRSLQILQSVEFIVGPQYLEDTSRHVPDPSCDPNYILIGYVFLCLGIVCKPCRVRMVF